MKAIILIVSVALLVTIAATEPQVSLENNVDRPGMNYKSYPLSSADPQVCPMIVQMTLIARLLLMSNQDLEGQIPSLNAG
jgi:hypothetical protein